MSGILGMSVTGNVSHTGNVRYTGNVGNWECR